MSYYTALIAAWNNATQPPPGVTGTALTAQMTTAQKLAAVNAWTVTGSAPTAFTLSGSQILNLINVTEFNALTAQQQQNILALCQVPGGLVGGSAETAFLVDGLIISYFPSNSLTLAALTAFANSQVQLWWSANGYQRPFDTGDLQAAGGLT